MRNMRIAKYLLPLVVVVCLVACSNKRTTAQNSSNDAPKSELYVCPFEELNGTWKVVKIYDDETETPLPYVELDVKKMVMTAYANCNMIGGEIVRKSRTVNALSFEHGFSTEMLCPDIIEVEDSLKRALNETVAYENERHTLYFLNEDGKRIVALQQ